MWIDEEKGQVFQKMDVLDTPTGRVIDTLLRAGCQVGVSTRAEGDLEEAEDNEGKFSRVIPESYKYITTDFTADPSTFGVIPLDVKQNVESRIKAELKNKGLKESERTFAKMLLESIQKTPEKKEMTLEQAVKEKIVKEGTKFVFSDGDYKNKEGVVKKIEEAAISVAVHDEGSADTSASLDVSITGDSIVTINPDKSVLIVPSTLEPVEPASEEGASLESEEELGNTGFGMPAVEPEEEEEIPEEPEEEEEEEPKESRKVDETIKKEKDGWHVYSKKGKHLGGPYSSKEEAKKRLGQVEMFKHMKEGVKAVKQGDTVQILDKEGNTVIVPHTEVHQVDEALGNDGEMYTTVEVTGSEDEDEQQWYSEEQYDIVVLKSASESKEIDENWEDLPKGWTKKSLASFARSLTKKTKGDSKGFVTACVAKMKGQVKNPEAFCAGLKDEYLDTTKWRGKESKSVSDVAKEIRDLKVKEASTRAERDKAIELLEKLEDEEKQLKEFCSTRALEVKILSKKLKNLTSTDEKVIAALRQKLEEKVAKIKKLNKQIAEMRAAHEEEISALKESITSLKKKMSEEIRRAEEDITKGLVKQFVDFRLAESGLTVDDNSRALLENCETLDQVDDVLEEIRDIKRRGALHSGLLEKVTVKSTRPVDPEQVDVNKKVGMIFEGLGYKKR